MYTYLYIIAAFPIWTFILVLGLHFWFNSKIELIFQKKTYTNAWNFIFKSQKSKIHSSMIKTDGRSSMRAYSSMPISHYPRLRAPLKTCPENHVLS